MNDDVVYPSGNSFYVNLETGIDIKVNTFKITGKVCFEIYSVYGIFDDGDMYIVP